MPISTCHVRFWPTWAALALLAGCEPAGIRPAGVPAPASAEALLADADAALARGDLVAAASGYRRAAEASDDERIAEQATHVALDNDQLREAAMAADRWLVLNPTSDQAHRSAGVVALRLHRLDKADAEFSQLVASAYISPAAGFLSLLPVVEGEGVPTDVTELFRRLAARYPRTAEAQYVLGDAALRSENFALALDASRRATELAPYWVPARLQLARATIASGKDDEGLAMARDLVMAPDSDVGTQIEYALLLAGAGHDEEARAMLTPYATGRTVVPGAVRTLGALDLDAGALDAAAGHFQDLLSTGAQSYEALYFLGLIAERRKDEERALQFYSRVAGGGYAMPAQQRVARIKAKRSGIDAGLLHLDEFGRAQPELGPELVAAKAALASSLEDEKRALAILDAGLQRYPDSLDLRMARVFLYERAGHTDSAIRDLRALLKERPGDATVQNALGFTLADHDRQLPEAQALVTAALEQSPDSAAILDSMGWVLYRLGRPAEALGYLQRAKALGNDPEIELHLGEAQWAGGDQAAARKTWQAGVERYPDDDKLRERLKHAGQ